MITNKTYLQVVLNKKEKEQIVVKKVNQYVRLPNKQSIFWKYWQDRQTNKWSG